MSTLKVTNIQSNGAGFNDVVSFQNSSGTQNGTLCRTWVNFNGTGVVAIRASFNVSSITDNGAGSYTVNFTTAMADANYTTVATISPGSSLNPLVPTLAGDGSGTYSTSAIQVATWNQNTLATSDTARVCVAIFR
jgi:hypothetical protein